MSNGCALLVLLAVAGCPAAEVPRPAPPVGDTRVAPDTLDVQGVTGAAAEIDPAGRGGASGTVRLTASDRGIRVQIELDGLAPGTRHGVQILHGRTCDADPSVHLGAAEGSVHGTPFLPVPDRHAGDLGNVAADDRGHGRYDHFEGALRLDSTTSAVGRAVVVLARADDGTTRPDGAAGDVIGCGTLKAAR